MGHAQYSIASTSCGSAKTPKISKTLDHVMYSGLGLLLLATVFSAVGLTSSRTSALNYSTNTTASVHVSSTCSMSTNPSGTDTPHTTTLVNGGFNDTGIGVTTIKSLCNDASGYAIYAIGFTGDTLGGNTLHDSTDTTSSRDIPTGTSLNGTVSNWAMKVTSGTNGPTIQNSYNAMHTVPDSFVLVAKYTSGIVPETGSYMSTTYGASISPSQPAGTYVGKVKYVLVHPNTYEPGAYTIAYHANGGSGGTDGTITEANVNNYESHNLLGASAFTAPTGGTFLGWCTTNTSMFSCNDGMSYSPGQATASLADTGGTVNLYAYWQVNSPMQTFKCSDINTVGGTKYLYDTRDNNVYLVGKLADNKCWMLDNLALDPLTATMNSTNTNATEAAITNFKTGGNPGGNDGWTTQAVVNKTSGWNNDSPNNAYEYPYVNVNFKNNTTTKFGTEGSGKIGVYYNYCAATVGTYCYASGAGVNVPDTITDAPIDICPANWRMPTGGSSGEYQSLCTTLNGGTACTNGMDMAGTGTNSLQYNLDLPLSGYFWNSSQGNVASYGYWWSSTYYSGNLMYCLRVNSGQVWPMGDYDRGDGFTMRCVAGS